MKAKFNIGDYVEIPSMTWDGDIFKTPARGWVEEIKVDNDGPEYMVLIEGGVEAGWLAESRLTYATEKK